MAVQFKWPYWGIIIPCLLIGGIGYGSHYFVFSRHLSKQCQIGFEVTLSILWISYIMAIFTDPGRVPENFQPRTGEWKRWCKKCAKYKPERTHHCKQCNRCVLKMDHHCPWTYSCVGHENMGHFVRFLFWILVNTGYVAIELSKRVIQYYEDRNLPSYLIDKKEMAAVIVLLPVDFFIFISIVILYMRCMINWVFKGMTQIETWELERIDSQFHTERMWLQIRKNYFKLHGKQMPQLVSWNKHARFYEVDEEGGEGEEQEEEINNYNETSNSNTPTTTPTNNNYDNDDNDDRNDNEEIVPKHFSSDDLIFPYDLGIFQNCYHTFNHPWWWIIPFAKPPQRGYYFDKNEFADDDQLGLPWPPDGGNSEFQPDPDIDLDQLTEVELRDLSSLRRRLDPRTKLKRSEWMNDMGETLDDFGVDLEAEDTEHDDLISNQH